MDYQVQYVDNEFFEEKWLGSENSYIASLVDGIAAEFSYKFSTESEKMDFDYTYRIDARLLIEDVEKDTPYYIVEENIFPEKKGIVQDSSSVQINEKVSIDYLKFDQIASSFKDTYSLKSASSTLIVTLYVKMLGSNQGFGQEMQNEYDISLNIPLAQNTFNIYTTASSPENVNNVFECEGTENRNVLRKGGIVTAVLACLFAMVLGVYMLLTRNEDIAYSTKIFRILKWYGSYIYRMNEDFECDGYQEVIITSFTEMLGIRDTIQSPILVYENSAQTMSRFYIPTNTKILYVFEIKVGNYEEIHATTKMHGSKK